MLRDWLADAPLLCIVLHLVLYCASPLSRSQSFGCFACLWLCSSSLPLVVLFCLLLTLLFCLLLTLLFPVLLILSPLLDDERCSASVPVLLLCFLFTTGSSASGSVSDSHHLLLCCGSICISLSPLASWLWLCLWSSQETLCGRLHLPGRHACTSNTTTHDCALRDRWLAVGARAPRSCSLQQRVLQTVRTGLRGSLPLRSVGGFQCHSHTTVWFSGLCPPSWGRLASAPLACPRSSCLSLVWVLSPSLSHATSLHVCSWFSLLHCTWELPTILYCADQSFCWMRNSVFSFLCELVFLLNGVSSSLLRPSLLFWLGTSLSAGLPRWSLLLSYLSRASGTSGTDSSAACPWSFSRSFSQALWLEICVQLSVSVLFQRLFHNLAGDRITFFHDLVVYWRNGEVSVQIRSFAILLANWESPFKVALIVMSRDR